MQPLGYECPDESGRNAEWERLNIKAFAKNKQFKISKIMQTMLLRVVSSGEMISVKSEKSENGGVRHHEVPDEGVQRTGVHGHRCYGNR